MAQDYFDQILSQTGGQDRSVRWYQRKIQQLGVPSRNYLIREGRSDTDLNLGKMNFYVYDPKHKKTLPYYDKFPLVIPFEERSWGFIGINFHYISIPYRLALLEKLTSRYTRGDNDRKRLLFEWNNISKFKEVRPAVKKYLKKHVRSPYVEIMYEEMKLALLLPVQKFEKATINKVYYDSRSLINI